MLGGDEYPNKPTGTTARLEIFVSLITYSTFIRIIGRLSGKITSLLESNSLVSKIWSTDVPFNSAIPAGREKPAVGLSV